jgi:hypothetical protein
VDIFWLSNAAFLSSDLETVVDSVAAVDASSNPEGGNFCSNTRLADRESEVPAFMPYVA